MKRLVGSSCIADERQRQNECPYPSTALFQQALEEKHLFHRRVNTVWDDLTSLNCGFSCERHMLEPSVLQKVDTDKENGASSDIPKEEYG